MDLALGPGSPDPYSGGAFYTAWVYLMPPEVVLRVSTANNDWSGVLASSYHPPPISFSYADTGGAP
jgi:hypothetical protein